MIKNNYGELTKRMASKIEVLRNEFGAKSGEINKFEDSLAILTLKLEDVMLKISLSRYGKAIYSNKKGGEIVLDKAGIKQLKKELDKTKNLENDNKKDKETKETKETSYTDWFETKEIKLELSEMDYKNLIDFQISNYEKVEVVPRLKIVKYVSDITSDEFKVFASYQDLWEQVFKVELIEDIKDNFSMDDFICSSLVKKSYKIFEKLSLTYEDLGKCISESFSKNELEQYILIFNEVDKRIKKKFEKKFKIKNKNRFNKSKNKMKKKSKKHNRAV